LTALKASEVESFVARPDPARMVVLVYGEDAGLVRERVEALVAKSVDDPKDPFQLARLEGDELASDPARLVEEASTIPLFGGRRAVWVKAGARNMAPALERLIASGDLECRVVIEAGELRRNAPLRVICERAKNAVALPCYPDAERDLIRLIDQEMRASGLTISPEARVALVPLLGGDRLASRQEIRKLTLFARGKTRVEVEDIAAVISDASMLEVDGLIDAAFAGKRSDVEIQFAKARTAGMPANVITSAAQRQLSALHKARLAMEEGASLGEATAIVQPYLHFSRKSAVETALKSWTAKRLENAMARLAESTLAARKQSSLAIEIVERALLEIAAKAAVKT
jgi:DNA polymerase III subunit delta